MIPVLYLQEGNPVTTTFGRLENFLPVFSNFLCSL
jgi:hypothetical protein